MAIRLIRRSWLLVFAVSACSPETGGNNAPAKFQGLSQAQVSSFTSSPDGCIISMLFDDFQAPPRVPSKAVAIPTRSFTLASSPEAARSPITFNIRGAVENAAGAKVRLKVGNQQFLLEPKSENFSLQARAPAEANGQTRAEVSLELPSSEASKPTDMLLVIDSIDVSLGGCGAKK